MDRLEKIFKDEISKKKIRSTTVDDYVYILNRLGINNLDSVDKINEKIKQLTKSTGSLAVSAVKKYLILTGREEEVELIKKVKHKSKEKIMFLDSSDKIKLLLDNCKKEIEYLVVKLMLETGIRRSVVLEIKPKDITSRSNIIIRKNYKGNKIKEDYLTPPISSNLLDRIKQYILKNKIKENDHIFLNYFVNLNRWESKKGKTSPEHKLTLLVLELGAKVGLHISPHGLRHTFGTFYYMVTKDIVSTSKALGQKNIQNTMRYVNWANSLDKTSIKKVRKLMFGG